MRFALQKLDLNWLSYIEVWGAAVSGAAETRTERILLHLAGGIHGPNHHPHPLTKKIAKEAEA